MLDLGRMEACDEYTVPVMLLDKKFVGYSAIVIEIPPSLSLVVFHIARRAFSISSYLCSQVPVFVPACSPLAIFLSLGDRYWLARLELP